MLSSSLFTALACAVVYDGRMVVDRRHRLISDVFHATILKFEKREKANAVCDVTCSVTPRSGQFQILWFFVTALKFGSTTAASEQHS